MQADIKRTANLNELSSELREMVEHPVPFESKRMKEALADPRIKQVRVFKLKKGKLFQTFKGEIEVPDTLQIRVICE